MFPPAPGMMPTMVPISAERMSRKGFLSILRNTPRIT